MNAENVSKSIGLSLKNHFFSGRISVLHIVVVGLSLMMTLGAYQYSKTQSAQRIEQRFETSRDGAVRLIHDRMANYEDALWAGVSAIESHGSDLSLDQWRIFAQNLRIEERYPGINGIGVIHFVDDQSRSDYFRDRLAERPEFKVFPPHDHEILMPISFIEPEIPNAAAVGLDVAHETNRRTAALASRDTGTAQISGPIVLVQDAGATPGFLFYAPVYLDGIPKTVEDRRDRIVGTVYAPFVVRNLMLGLLAKDLRNVGIGIADDGEKIYDENVEGEALFDPNPLFTDTVTLDLYGRIWELDIRSNLAFRNNNSFSQPTVILFGGLLIEALIITLLVMMSRANLNSVTYADKVTEELRLEQEKLVKTNFELEQFAYATSHDLKTPIRGIGGLTEMIKEDLAEYLALPSTSPDIGENLDLILERVNRMNNLTAGIIAFSRVGEMEEESKSLDLKDMYRSLLADLSLSPEALSLDGEVEQIDFDPVNCGRVLQNLVENAVKYHDGKEPIAIEISVADTGSFLEFSVKDNGPGIEPCYQTKIFDMFQTLRVGTSPESTGIGLAIVKKAVELNGGSIRVESSLGLGSQFIFQWPKGDSLLGALTAQKAA